MRKLAVGLLVLSLARIASAQILETEVWVGSVDLRNGFEVSSLKNISNHRGYDNQPSFFRDGQSLLYTAEAANLDDTGLGVHAVRYNAMTGKATPLPQARGFSPTPTAGGQIMLLRQGGVWLHDANGKLLRNLVDTKEAGYFCRFEDDRWVLFMNDKDRRIVLYDAMSGTLETMINGAITAPYRVPEQRAVTFVVDANDVYTLHRLDIDSKQLTTLATIPFKTGGHHVWTPRGTIFIGSGPDIHEWDPRQPNEWPVVHHFDDPDLQGITRIALNATADRIAIVSTARDETVLRNSRSAANDAMADALKKFRGTSYVRTTESLQMTSDSATERGTWVRRWRTAEGPVELRGRYTTVWHREIGDNGTPSWSITNETVR